MQLKHREKAKTIICLFIIFCCLSCSNKKSKISEVDIKFQTLKDKGVQSIKADRLSEGIDSLLEALKIKQDNEISEILDQAYLERGEYYFTAENYSLAYNDISKIKIKSSKANQIQNKILSKKYPDLLFPTNNIILETDNFNLQWKSMENSDFYQLHIEDEDWNQIMTEDIKTNFFQVKGILKRQKNIIGRYEHIFQMMFGAIGQQRNGSL